MSAQHAPECPAGEDRPWHWMVDCICEALATCEQRVLQTKGAPSAAWTQGYQAGLFRAANIITTYADERLRHTEFPNSTEDIHAALTVASNRVYDAARSEKR